MKISKYEEHYKDMVKYYQQGRSILSVSKIFNCSNQVVRNALSHYEISPRSKGQMYMFDSKFFNNIDSEHKAYWLGMIATDGTIRKNRNEIILSLGEIDRKHLIKFLGDIKSNGKVYSVIRSGSKQAYISISSAVMKNNLISLGIKPNKSLSLQPPSAVRYNRHFWRGCFDGDGSIAYINHRGGQWRISFNGTFDMVNGFKDFVDTNVNVNDNVIYKRGNIYSVSYGAIEQVKLILDLLYSDSSVYLDRKYDRYKRIKVV